MRVAFRLALIQLTIMQLPPTPFSLVYLFFIFIFLLLYFFFRHRAPRPSTLSSSCTSFHYPLVSKLVRTHSQNGLVLMVDSVLRLFRVRGLAGGSCATLARALSTDLLFLYLTVFPFLCCHRFCRLARQTCVVKKL